MINIQSETLFSNMRFESIRTSGVQHAVNTNKYILQTSDLAPIVYFTITNRKWINNKENKCKIK